MSQIFTIKEHELEYTIEGNGSPVFVFFNGDGMDFEYSWREVISKISNPGKLVLFNRFGTGKSSKPKIRQSGITVIDQVLSLLEQENLHPPYILVGHSIGGLFINLFARLHPDKIGGVVFVDATHPETFEFCKDDFTFVQKILIWLAAKLNKYSEIASLDETIKQIESLDQFPKVPVHVLAGAKADFPRWVQKPSLLAKKLTLCRKLASLAPGSSYEELEECGHFIAQENPDAVVSALHSISIRLAP